MKKQRMVWTPELILIIAQLVTTLLPYAKELIVFIIELIKSLQEVNRQNEMENKIETESNSNN